DLAVVLVLRRAEHGAHVLLVERLGRPGEDEGEVGGVDDREGDPDEPGAPAGEAARGAVRREAVVAHDAEHGLARLRRDVGAPVQDAGYRRDRDARGARDVPNRRARALADRGGAVVVLGERVRGADVSETVTGHPAAV